MHKADVPYGPMTSIPRQSARNAFLAVFVLALLIRIGFCAWTHRGPYPFRDQYREYIIAGQRLLEQGAFLSPLMADAATAEDSGLLPPLYTIWVAGVFGLFGVESTAAIWVLELANAAALALACALVFSITSEMAGRRAGWIAAWIATLNPALIGYANYVWDTSFFTLCVTFSFWISWRISLRPFRGSDFLFLGIWLGFVALLNPALTPAYPLLVLFPLWRLRTIDVRKLARGVALATLGWMIAIAPWTIRNYVQLGRIQYVRSGLMLEVWLGVVPEADHAGGSVYRKHFPLNNPDVARHIAQVGEKKYVLECGEKARKAIVEHPTRFAQLVGMRTIDYWLGTTLTHATPQQKIIPATRQRQIIMLVFTTEALVIFAALFSGRFRSIHGLWLVAILILFSIIYCLTHVQVRFRVPVEPIAAIIMCLLIRRESRHPPVGLASA